MANSIFPPVLPSKQYSFQFQSVSSSLSSAEYYMKIQFELSPLNSIGDDTHCQISIKYAETGRCAVADGYSPDRATIFIDNKNLSITDPTKSSYNLYFHKVDGTANTYEIAIPNHIMEGGNFKPSTTYSIQIRFGNSTLWNGYKDRGLGMNEGYANFATWRKGCVTSIPSKFGEWSNVTRIFCYQSPVLSFTYDFYDFLPEIKWTYSPVSADPLAQVTVEYSYETAEETITESQIFSGTTTGDNVFTLSTQFNIAPLFTGITGTIHGLTQNNTKIDYDFSVPAIQIISSGSASAKIGRFLVWGTSKVSVTDLDLGQVAQEDGIIGKLLEFKQALSDASTPYSFSIFRVDLLTLKAVKLASQVTAVKGEKIKFRDYTVEMGARYEYIFTLTKTSSTQMEYFLINPVSPYGEGNLGYGRLMRMEAAFLDDPNHQLKLIGNLKISSFKRNTSDNFQTTIGATYPFYSRNSKMNYRTLQLSAAVSINFDPTSVFLRLDPENGLMWDEGNAVVTFTATEMKEIADIQAKITTNQNLLEAEEKKITTVEYQTDPVYKQQVDANIKKYFSLVELYKAELAVHKDTRGATHLVIWDTDLYEKIEASLSRRRARGPQGGPDTLEQEMVDSPYGFDDASLIAGPQAVFNKMLYQQSGVSYDTSSSDRMVYMERVFRDYVMKWLSNGKPKLFRSENEGNMIVMVSNASFAPLEATNRKIYTLSCTLTEIAEYKLDELINYNLIPSVIECDYDEVNLFDFTPGGIDPNVRNSNFNFSHIEDYYIGPTLVNKTVTVNLAQALVNGSGSYTFAMSNPSYGTVKINASTGVLTWTPTLDSSGNAPSAQIITITATDKKTKEVATTSFFIDRGYKAPTITFTGTTATTKEIAATTTGTSVLTGVTASDGLAPLTFAASNLPSDIVINSSTGEISGVLSETTSAVTATIQATDSAGNVSNTASLKFAGVSASFIFDADYVYTIPSTEVDKSITAINFMNHVSGGTSPYTFSAPSGLPTGLTLNASTGILTGTANAAITTTKTFIIRCTDSKSVYLDAHVTMLPVIAAFKIYDYTTGVYPATKTYDFLLSADGKSLSKIAVGTKNTGAWTTLSGAVTGGVPWEKDGVSYYIYESSGLEPNFQIDPTTGDITGVPHTAGDGNPTTATVKVRDSRGCYATDSAGNDYITITISPIVSEMFVKENKGVFNLPETVKYNLANHNGTLAPYLSLSSQATSYGFTFKISDVISGGQSPFTLSYTATDFPSGISITCDNSTMTVTCEPTSIESSTKKINGLEPFSPRTSYFYLQDSLQQRVALKVNIGQIYETLTWTQTQVKVPSDSATALFVGDEVDYSFTNIEGGKPNYKFVEIKDSSSGLSVLPEGIAIKNNDISSSTMSGFSGTIKEANQNTVTVQIKVWDDLGQYVNKSFLFCRVYYPLTLTVNKDFMDGSMNPNSMDNYAFIYNYTEIKAHDAANPYQINVTNPDTHKIALKPFNVSGGSGNYKFEWTNSSIGDPFAGLTITSEGYVEGKPTTAHAQTFNLNHNIWVTDTVLGIKAFLNEECWTAPVYWTPTTDKSTVTIKGSTDSNITAVTNIFRNRQSTTYGHGDTFHYDVSVAPKRLPAGLELYEQSDSCIGIRGKPLDACTNYEALIWMKLKPNNWTDSPEPTTAMTEIVPSFRVCKVICTITGYLRLVVNSEIPAGGIGDAIDDIVIGVDLLGASDYVSGGTGPYTITYKADSGKTIDPGFIFTTLSDGSLKISGSRTVVSSGYNIYLTVTDSKGTTATATLNYGGAYSKLYFNYSSDFDIPSMAANAKLTKTIDFIQNDASKGVYGGVSPYSFAYYALGTYGSYSIDNTTGVLTGRAKSSAQAAGIAQITVMDSKKQSASINIQIGQVIGKLSWSEALLLEGESISIPAGYKGEAFDDIHLAYGCYGGQGTKTWTITGITTSTSALWTPQLTLNSSTGVLSAGTRPKKKVGKTQVTVTVTDFTNTVKIILYFGAVSGIYWATTGGTSFGDGSPGKISYLNLGTVSGADPYTVSFSGTYANCLSYDATTNKLKLVRPSTACGDQFVDVTVKDAENDSETRTYYFACN